MKANTIYQGDCLEVMRQLPDNSVDSIITDPPYALTNRTPDVKRCIDCKRVLDSLKNCPRCGGKLSRQRSKQQRGFMGKEWDNEIAFNSEIWREALRVAKPGAFLMAFGGTRTYHRLTCAIEDAGWEIRDCVTYFHDASFQEAAFMDSLSDEQLAAYLELHKPNNSLYWLYGSGFPKSQNISKALDAQAIVTCPECEGKAQWFGICSTHGEQDVTGMMVPPERFYCPICDERMDEYWRVNDCEKCNGAGKVKGAEREVIGEIKKTHISTNNTNEGWHRPSHKDENGNAKKTMKLTTPATPLAAKFDGYGTALKPSFEPIVVAMKPVDKNFANNAQRWGLSGLWIDGGRVEAQKDYQNSGFGPRYGETSMPNMGRHQTRPWVQDAVKNGEPVKDSQSHPKGRWPANTTHDRSQQVENEFAKAGVSVSRGSRTGKKGGNNGVLKNFSGSTSDAIGYWPEDIGGTPSRFFYTAKASPSERGHYNNHPTCKPLELMKYLCRITRNPDGGIVLDPFAGSGTTALAAIAENRDYILIEKEPDYVAIAKRRIAEYTGQEIEEKKIELDNGEQVKQLGLW